MTTSAVARIAYGMALALAAAWSGLILLASAGNGTLGFDYKAYDLAVDNLLAGRTMYDPNAQSTGSFGLFFYPPPFALMVLPLALLPTALGVWIWTALLVAASVAAIWLMPVSSRTRWIVLLLAALSWPLVYAIKLGQVGPILLLLFSVGWRWLDRPGVLGASAGIGTLVKLQPALIIGWAVATGRRRAAMLALAIVVIGGAVATLVAGPGSWLEEASLLGRVSQPVLTPNGVGVARLAYLAGLTQEAATVVHWLNLAAIVAVVGFVVFRGTPVASYLAVVVASQFVSPVLWDHYALLLLLPVAWLIDRGWSWAAVVPLATATVLAGISPLATYPVAFWVVLVALAWQGTRPRDHART